MTTADRVKEIIREQLGIPTDELTPGTRFIDDLGCDSLDTVELAMELEEEFSIEIPDADLGDGTDKTVGEVIAYIERKVSPPQSPTMFKEEA